MKDLPPLNRRLSSKVSKILSLMALVFGVMLGGTLLTAGMPSGRGCSALNRPPSTIRLAPADPAHPDGPQFGPIWGDIFKRPSGFMIKLPAGFRSEIHVHSADYRGIVLSGVLVNAQLGEAGSVPLPAGSYFYQPRDAKHVTACKPGPDCLTYVEFMGPFDSKPES